MFKNQLHLLDLSHYWKSTGLLNNRNHTQNHRFHGTKEVQGFSDGSNLEMVMKFRVCNFSMFCARIHDTFVDSRQKENNRPKNRNHTQNHRFHGTKEVQGFSDGSNLETVMKFRVCNFSMFCARIYDTFVDSRQKENNRPKISRNCKDCQMCS